MDHWMIQVPEDLREKVEETLKKLNLRPIKEGKEQLGLYPVLREKQRMIDYKEELKDELVSLLVECDKELKENVQVAVISPYKGNYFRTSVHLNDEQLEKELLDFYIKNSRYSDKFDFVGLNDIMVFLEEEPSEGIIQGLKTMVVSFDHSEIKRIF